MMHSGWMFGIGWLFWLFLAVIVGLAIWSLLRPGHAPRVTRERETRETPDEVLRRRFARGEIDEAEYRSRMEMLHHGV